MSSRPQPEIVSTRDFAGLLGEKNKTECGQYPDSEPRQQRLAVCFQALLEGHEKWTDGCVSVRLAGYRRLQWRILTGPLKGCSICAVREGGYLHLEMTASDGLATRLKLIRSQLEQRIGHLCGAFFITIKVTRESKYT